MTDQPAAKPNPVVGLFDKGWFWFSQATSIVGLISIIDDLKLWLQMAGQAIAWLNGLAPALAQVALQVGAAIHAVLEIFRGIVRPIFDFLLDWLPFTVPQLAKDAAVVVVFVSLGLLRVARQSMRDFEAADAKTVDEALAKTRAFGLNADPSNIRRVLQAAIAFNVLNQPFLTEETKTYWQDDYQKHEQAFGAPLEPFLRAHPEIGDTHPAIDKWISGERAARWFVWIAAALTAALVIADAILMPG